MAWTVQKLIDERMTLYAWCNACHHNRTLDLMMLRERLGRDAPAMAPDLTPDCAAMHAAGGMSG